MKVSYVLWIKIVRPSTFLRCSFFAIFIFAASTTDKVCSYTRHSLAVTDCLQFCHFAVSEPVRFLKGFFAVSQLFLLLGCFFKWKWMRPAKETIWNDLHARTNDWQNVSNFKILKQEPGWIVALASENELLTALKNWALGCRPNQPARFGFFPRCDHHHERLWLGQSHLYRNLQATII